MFKNYLRIAFRSLRRQKGYAAINVLGLALGLALCMLIARYVIDEASYDRHHAHADRIVRVLTDDYNDDGDVTRTYPYQPFMSGPVLEEEVPEIVSAVRFLDGGALVRADAGEEPMSQRVLFADPSVFEVFSFPLRAGDPGSALARLDGVVLSSEMAERLFGDADALGQTVDLLFDEAYEPVVVMGVAEPIPQTSSVRFDVLLPFASVKVRNPWLKAADGNWNSSSFYTYALLQPNTDVSALAPTLQAVRTANAEPDLEAGAQPSAGFRLQPLAEVHRDVSIPGGMTPPSDPRYSTILAAIALAVLLIACINYVTLALSRSARRGVEVGVRKTLGAQKGHIAAHFFAEAVLLCGFAFALGLAMAHLALPVFNTLSGKALSLEYGIPTVAFLLGLLAITTFGAGGYPALVIARLNPTRALKSRLRLSGSGRFTQALVVLQFALSISFIVGTFVMVRQLDYVQSKSLGYNQEQVVVASTGGADGTQVLDRLRSELGSRTDILGMTAMDMPLTNGHSVYGWGYDDRTIRAQAYNVDPHYLDVMQITLVGGRGFEEDRPSDPTEAVVINEALAREYGWTEANHWANAIGQQLDGLDEDEPRTVIGVVQDFHFRSLHEPIEPVMLRRVPAETLDHVMVRLAPGDISTALDELGTAWADALPGAPFNYTFLDDALAQQYRAEQRWSRIVGWAAGIAIFVACLGLLGLAAITMQQRTKEVGVRKVLGASLSQVTVLLSRDFLGLVGVAFVLAVPLSVLAMNRWLQVFEYRIELGPVEFLAAGLLVLLVALATVSSQALRAATVDPVRALRSE
ncbi:MAG: ABC transporter permease [Rubricoccaceae bacterium]